MHLRKITAVLIVFVVGITGVSAYLPQPDMAPQPTEVSDEELKKFAAAFSDVQVIDQQLQEEMMATVEEEGIDVARFNDYLESKQKPEQEFEATGKEKEKFETVFEKIEGMHDKAEQEMQQAIVDKDLSVDRYQQIAQYVSENPALLQKFQQHFPE